MRNIYTYVGKKRLMHIKNDDSPADTFCEIVYTIHRTECFCGYQWQYIYLLEGSLNFIVLVYTNMFLQKRCGFVYIHMKGTDLEQLQYDLCEGSTKSQATTFSVNSSSHVPLVAAENFRLKKMRE